MPSDSREDSQRDQSPIEPSESPLTSLIHQVFAIPRTIYQRGVDRGDDWRQRRDQYNRDQISRDGSWQSQGSSANPVSSSYRRTSPSDNADDDGDDWVSWLKGEMARGERRAKEMYDSWESTAATEAQSERENVDDSTRTTDHIDDFVKTMQHVDEFKRQLDFIHELERSREQSIVEKLFGTWSDSPGPMSADKTNGEPVANTGMDPETHYDLWHLLPQLLRSAAMSWEPEEAYVASYMVNYAMASPYSPLHLEDQAGFDKSWRARFEDLVRAEQGQPLLTNEEITTASNQGQAEWLVNLADPTRNRHECAISRRTALSNPNNSDETELAAYDNIASRPQPGYLKEAIQRHWSLAQNDSADHSSTVSSVTRTVDSYTEPDGSTTRKTVVHRIFQDGREETSENIEKMPARPRGHADHSRSTTKKETETAVNNDHLQEPEQSRRGWFWSK